MNLSAEESYDLFRWNDPLTLALAVSPRVPEDAILATEGKYKKHREAWTLSRFAVGYEKYFKNKTQVKMVNDREQSPDGIVKIDSKDIPFEVTMVVHPDRRMAQEIKKAAEEASKARAQGDTWTFDAYVPSKAEVLDWIGNALEQKKAGAYPGLHLLIYLNVWQEELDYKDLLPLAFQAKRWSDVWIICSRGWGESYSLSSITNNHIPGWFPFDLKAKPQSGPSPA